MALARTKEFSLIIPTYSGLSTLPDTFESILKQDANDTKYEVVVVIDGPSHLIREVAERASKKFQKNKIAFEIKQLKKNKGRFEARLIGAKAANYGQLLFVDDRVRLADDFFYQLGAFDAATAIPNVVEEQSENLISQTLFIFRRAVYGKKWGQSFEDYVIDNDSFEASPKGTTCLWVEKDLFIDACKKTKKAQNSRYVNEDTKILKQIVNSGKVIMRTSKLAVRYTPRGDFSESVRHLYDRGPRFVDYYIKPKTRFFPLLIVLYLSFGLAILTAFLRPLWLLFYLAFGLLGVLIFGLIAARNMKEYRTLIIGAPLAYVIFALGVIKGTVVKIKK